MADEAISVVTPAYNDAQTIIPILTSLEKSLRATKRDYEIVVLDDESHDGTVEILRGWPKSRRFRVYFHKKNQGMAKTFRELNTLAKNPIVVQFSLDGEWDPTDVMRLVTTLEKGSFDMVIGVRHRQNYGWARKFISLSYKFLTRFFFGVETYDAGSIKATKLSLLREIPLVSVGIFEEAERIIRAIRLGYRIGTIPVRYQPARKAYRLLPKIPLVIQSVIDLVRFRLS